MKTLVKKIMCVYFPSWSIQRIKRVREKRNDSQHKANQSLVIVETIRQKTVVVSACKLAIDKGIRLGMTPTQVRAIDAKAEILPRNSEEDLQALQAVGRWMMRFSPVVAIEKPSSLFIDLLGLEGLFGPPETILMMVDQAITRLRLFARIAIAPTPGAAWAFAVYGHKRLAIIPAEQLSESLSTLPVQALRIEPSISSRLNQLGVKSIGQAMPLSRNSLATRFGRGLLSRIDQANGEIVEPLVGLQTFVPVIAKIQFEYAIESLDTIWLVFQRLIAQIIRELSRRGRGARIIQMTLTRAYAAPINEIIQLSRPSRNPANLFNLMRLALENIETGEGFTGVRLEVRRSEAIADEQIPLIEHKEKLAESKLIHLIERLIVLLGVKSVLRASLAESHIPECAFQWNDYRDADVKAVGAICTEPAYIRTMPRPLHLLSTAIEVPTIVTPSDDREGRPVSFTYQGTVNRLSIVSGPERIHGEWWKSRDKIRDYFDVQTLAGKRFWIFRVQQTGKWFLHGCFE